MIAEITPGMHVSWIREQRGGYGFAIPVDAVVVKVCRSRVRIEVLLRDGRRVERVVRPESLRKAALVTEPRKEDLCDCELRDRLWNGYGRCLRCGCKYIDRRPPSTKESP